MSLKLLKDKPFEEQIENSGIRSIITFIVAVKEKGVPQWLTLYDDFVIFDNPILADELEYDPEFGDFTGFVTLMGIKECLRFIMLHELLHYHPSVAIIGGTIPENTNYAQVEYEHVGNVFISEEFIPRYIVKEFRGRYDRMKFFDAIYNLDRVDKLRKR